MNDVYIRRLNESARLPEQAHPGEDVGWDLYVSRDVLVGPRNWAEVHFDVAIAMPNETWAMLAGRSSSIRRLGLRVEVGIIDPGYRGELSATVYNLRDEECVLRQGTRIAQILFMQKMRVGWRETNILPPTQRGEEGYGSTGI